MAIKEQVNYRNGAKLFIFRTGGMKYEPSQAYKDHVAKMNATCTRTETKKPASTEKNASKLIDAFFMGVTFSDTEELTVSKNTFGALRSVDTACVDTKNGNELPVMRTTQRNYLRLCTSR
jgi:hypothetical protein